MRLEVFRIDRRAMAWRWGAVALAGTLDMAFAVTFWSLRGVSPVRILQSVASGLLGRAAFEGGALAALLGLTLHYLIVLMMVIVYESLALSWGWPLRRPWLAGMLYGGGLYLTMTFVVVPLSAAQAGSGPPEWIVGSILSHLLLVGVPCAWCMRRRVSRPVAHPTRTLPADT